MERSQEGVLVDLDDLTGRVDSQGQEEEEIALAHRHDHEEELCEEDIEYVPPPGRNHASKFAPPPPMLPQRQQTVPPPSPPSDHIARQSNVDPGPGAYRVSPGRYVMRASVSSESSAVTIERNALPTPSLPSLVEAEPVVSSYLVEATLVDPEMVPEPLTSILESASCTPDSPEPTSIDAFPLSQPPPIQREGPVRRKRLALLLALGFAVVAGVVGVAVWAATRSTGSPAPGPSPPPDSSRAPPIWSEDSLATCSLLKDSFDDCVSYYGSEESDCERCVVNSWGVDPGLVTDCSQVAEETCASLSSCSQCAGCVQEFVDYFECRSDCLLAGVDGCTFTPSATPVTSPAPSGDRCSQPQTLFNECVGYSGTRVSECEQCIIDKWPVKPSNVTSCTQIDDETCIAIATCTSCAGCEQELLTYVECASNCDLPSADACARSTSAPTAAPTDACSNLKANFDRCASNACSSCRNKLIDEGGPACADIENRTCNIGEYCPDCAPCLNDLIAWNNCENEGSCSTFTCASPSQAPTPYPCPEEFDAYWGCVAEYNAGDSSDCRACRNEFFPNSTRTCADVEYLSCHVSEECPECGPCHDEQVAWSDCYYQINGGCGPSNCTLASPSASPSTEPTTGTAGDPA